jgi:hypothetical protein
MPGADAPAAHAQEDGDAAGPHRLPQAQVEADLLALLALAPGRLADVAADAEGPVAGPGEDHHPDSRVARRLLERRAELEDGPRAQGVQPIGPVDGDRQPAAGAIDEEVLQGRHGGSLPSVGR